MLDWEGRILSNILSVKLLSLTQINTRLGSQCKKITSGKPCLQGNRSLGTLCLPGMSSSHTLCLSLLLEILGSNPSSPHWNTPIYETVVLKLQCPREACRVCENTDCWALPPRDCNPVVEWEFAFVTSSQLMLMLLVSGSLLWEPVL